MPPTVRAAVLLFLTAPLLFVAGCGPKTPTDNIPVATGIVYRKDLYAGVQLLDVDLAAATVRPVVVAKNLERRGNNFIGDCKTVREWAEEFGAIGGMNAGYFGDTYDQLGRRKQIVGLLAKDGHVAVPADLVLSTKYPGQKFTRAAVGFTKEGTPDISWATGTLSGTLRRLDAPVNPTHTDTWRVHSAVGCGPRLFTDGAQNVTAKEERLVSPGKLARAFVAYDLGSDGKPAHFVMGRADAMEFNDVADYLADYFQRRYNTRPQDAMCLDGGPSAQLVYRTDGTLQDAEPTGVLVPTAILLLKK
jgi:hypothetical protein